MTQANDSILVTPGSGATVATTNPGDGKEYQVVMLAGRSGHLLGTKPTYIVQTPFQALAQNKHHITVFNTSGSNAVVTIQAIMAQKNFAAVTGVAWQLDMNWITAENGTPGGTLLTAKKYRQTNGAVPSQIAFRAAPTGAPTEDASIFQFSQFLHSEETNVAAQVKESLTIWPPGQVPVYAEWQDLTLDEGQGFTLKQITNTTAGTYAFAIVFCLE